MSDRDTLARAYDPEAFEDHPSEQRRAVAAIQWAARRKLATDAADKVLASGYLESVKADAWDEGERHESSYLNTWGQFCPHTTCNPYRTNKNLEQP